jgi:hypothetical protein
MNALTESHRGKSMRKLSAIALLIFGLALLAGTANAQTSSAATIYTVKFVCGTQAPNPRLVSPAEPPVKPGNYATVINIQSLAEPSDILFALGQVSVANVTLLGTFSPIAFTAQFQTVDVTCADIARRAGSAAAPFITGFYNIRTTLPLSVTAVYSSQGCAFPLPGIAALPPTCGGPTAVDVVVQQPALVPSTTTTE